MDLDNTHLNFISITVTECQTGILRRCCLVFKLTNHARTVFSYKVH